MSIEKLTKRLQGSIDFALDNEEDLDAASWNYQEGILITVNEAKLLLDIVKNCSIPDVSQQRELLIGFKKWHSDWGGKWFSDEHEASIVDEYLKTINCS
ncbi:hypothetical protein [Maribacter sp. 2307ULW6-5]|uniref:hypothetical protein n=1 Tax=Maribacter sp. 2307ULW6-5 TaxID=3386275 RepID=UPI0039BD078F